MSSSYLWSMSSEKHQATACVSGSGLRTGRGAATARPGTWPARGARCRGGSRSGRRSPRPWRRTWPGCRTGGRRSGRSARRGGSARRVWSRPGHDRRRVGGRLLDWPGTGRRRGTGRPRSCVLQCRAGAVGAVSAAAAGGAGRLAARVPGATGAAARTQRRNPPTVPGTSKDSRSSHRARPPAARQAEPSRASPADGSLAWTQRRTTAMSRSEASAYSALGMTQTVTDRGEVRSAASRFMVSEPSAQATFSTRSTRPGPAAAGQRQREQREDDRAGVQAERFQGRRDGGAFGVVDEGVLGAEAHVSLRGGQEHQQARTPRSAGRRRCGHGGPS